MVDKEVVVSIIIAGLILFLGMNVLSSYVNLGETTKSLLKDPSGFVLRGTPTEKTLFFNATLSFDEPQLISGSFSIPVKLVELSYREPNKKILVNSLDLTSQPENVFVMSNYEGKYTMTDTVSLDGTADSVKLNSVLLVPKNRIPVQTSGLDYSSVSLYGVPKTSLTLTKVSGTIYIYQADEDIAIQKKSGNVQITNFEGHIELYSGKILLQGMGTFKTDVLSSN